MNILDSLKTIFQEVNAARSLPEVLTIIVTEVQAAMNAEVCSVYLFDETDSRYVLMATKGLRQESIGKVRLQMGEGLVGSSGSQRRAAKFTECRQPSQFCVF
jgi:phosphotransferase system enzyme I (PtsP)